MKKIFKSLALVAAAAAVLASCQKPEIENPVKEEGTKVVYFGTQVNDMTKASLTTDDDANFTAAWENGDALTITGSDRGSHIADFPAVWNSEKGAFAASGDVELFFDEPYDFIGVYPQPVDDEIDFGSERTQNGNNYTGKYDVMLSKATTLTLTEGETVILPMDRQTAIAYFHLTSTLPEDEKIVSATLSVSENLAGSFMYVEGEITPDATANSITLSFTNAPSVRDLKLWFNVLPGAYTGLKLEVETENHTLTLNNASVTYEAGKLYKVAGNATSKYVEKEDPDGDKFVKVAANCDDWSGTYLIVYKDGDENLIVFNSGLETLDAANNGESVTSDANGDIALDETTAGYIFTVASMDGGYSVKASNGKYISGTAGANTLNANNTPSANTFTWDNQKKYVEVKANTYLTFNNASNQNRFRYMKTDKSNTYLYRLNGKFNPDFPTLTVVDQEVAGSYINVTIPVISNRSWTAEITSGAEFVDGGALTTASGSGDGNITFRFAGANSSYFKTQVVTLHIVADTKEADITITHKAKTGASLQINGETSNIITANVDADATQYVANITANFPEWTVLAYSIDGVAQATSGENCIRAYDAEAGTGTVTLKFPSNEAPTAKSIVLTVGYGEYISRTITITQAGEGGGDENGWIKKNFADITADDIFVIVMGSSALPNDNTDASPLAVGVTILGSKIASEVADNIKWTVTGNATDGYTFLSYANAQNALFSNTTASSSSNTSVRVGAPTSGTNRKVFEFATSDDGTKTTLKTKDSYTARYITLYSDAGNPKDWRAYTRMSNVAGSIDFYVFQDNRESQSLSFSAETGTIDMNGNVQNLPSLNTEGAYTSVTYSSSDESVAEVNATSGVVVAHKVGTVTITATADESAEYKSASAKYELTVSDSTPKTDLDAPTRLTWTESSKTLSWTDPNIGKGTYNTNYKYQYSVNGGSSWSDATSSTTAVLSIASTTTVKVKAVAITTATYNSSAEVSKECTISGEFTTKKTVTYTGAAKKNNVWQITTTGSAPSGSSASYDQSYNTLAQMTNGNWVKYTITGFTGKKITKISLSMKSNSSSGAAWYTFKSGTNVLSSIGSDGNGEKFNNAKWNGSWSTSYVTVEPSMTDATHVVAQGETLEVYVKATANSVYCQSVTIEYYE